MHRARQNQVRESIGATTKYYRTSVNEWGNDGKRSVNSTGNRMGEAGPGATLPPTYPPTSARRGGRSLNRLLGVRHTYRALPYLLACHG